MATHSLYDYHVLRTSAEVPDSGWEPIVQTDVVVIDTSCKSSKISSPEYIRDMIGANDEPNKGPIRAAPGMTYDHWDSGHGGSWDLQGVVTDYGYSLCRRLSVKPHPDKQYAFIAEIETSNMGRTELLTLGADKFAGAPAIRINVQSGLTMKPLFRVEDQSTGSTIYLPGDDEVDTTTTPHCFKYNVWMGDSNGSAEVQGKPIDISGTPVNMPVESRQIQLEVLRRWGHLRWPASGPDAEDWCDGFETVGDFEMCLPDWNGRVGSRNIDEQWGFGKGHLKLDAINVLPMHHDFKMYQYLFSYDEHKHAQQFTPALPTGAVIMNEASLTSIRGSNANEVYWLQPFLKGYRYQESDWPADEWDFLQTLTCD